MVNEITTPTADPTVEVWAGVSYPVSLRLTPATNPDGTPGQPFEAVMWTADLEVSDGVSLTAAASTPETALRGLARVAASRTALPGPVSRRRGPEEAARDFEVDHRESGCPCRATTPDEHDTRDAE